MATASSNALNPHNHGRISYKLPIGIRDARSQHRASMALQIESHSATISSLPGRLKLSPTFEQPITSTSTFGATDVSSRFGARLRDLRRSHRLTQLDMAIAFGIDRSYISDVECGKKGISLVTLEIIALGFSMKLSDLFEDL
jgi:DNA-binding XRE family transcriptional regulator